MAEVGQSIKWHHLKNARACSAAIAAMLAVTTFAAGVPDSVQPAEPDWSAGVSAGAPYSAAAKEQNAMEAGAQAVVYGLPLVLMDITMRKATNVSNERRLAKPVNQFVHLRVFPTAAFKDVVRANVDTLYSSAFLDLATEPLVLSIPDAHGRYYLLPMMDAWTDVFATPGSRTTGTKSRTFVITGPNWRGAMPNGMQRLESPTNMAWILGRTQTNGPSDYSAVHAIQDGYTLVPLSLYGKPYSPPAGVFDPAVDMNTPPVEQLKTMNAVQFFGDLARLLKANPPPASEAPILDKLAKIGVIPGEAFDPSGLDPALVKGLERSMSAAFTKLQEAQKRSGTPVNGWHIPPSILGD